MSAQPRFVSPFYRPQCLAAAAPAGKAKLTHPGKAILAGKKVGVRPAGSDALLRATLRGEAALRLVFKFYTLTCFVQTKSSGLGCGHVVFSNATNGLVGSVRCVLIADSDEFTDTLSSRCE